MALNYSTRYPSQIDGTDPSGYPYGKAQNVSVTGDGTGTPWEKDLANDWLGFFQAVLVAAGISPNGTPDKAGASQYLTGLKTYLVDNLTALVNGLKNGTIGFTALGVTGVSSLLGNVQFGGELQRDLSSGGAKGVSRLGMSASKIADADQTINRNKVYLVEEINSAPFTVTIDAPGDSSDWIFFRSATTGACTLKRSNGSTIATLSGAGTKWVFIVCFGTSFEIVSAGTV